MLSNAGRLVLALTAVGIVAGAPWALGRVPASLFTGRATVVGAAVVSPPDTLGAIPARAWLNAPGGDPVPASFRGSVVLVEFWTYLCYNCKNVEGWMKSTYERYRGRGLVVLGVHTPEFAVERDVENVRRYLHENGIDWPVAIDNDYAVWRRYNATNAWPALLVFDRSGRLVYRDAGEGAVRGAERAIEKSLTAPARSIDAGADEDAVDLEAFVRRVDADRAVLTVELAARPGIRVVRRPGNELRIETPPDVTAPDGPVLLGEPTEPSDATGVVYFDGPASVDVPLALVGAGPFEVRGRLTYRFCDDAEGICKSRERPFAVTIPRS